MTCVERRQAEPADREFARLVHHHAFKDVVTRQFGPWDEAEQDRFFEQGWAQDGITILTADGTPVGYMRAEDRAGEIFLATIAIAPEFQCRGFGSEVLSQEIARAKAQNVPLVLQVLRSNRALSLYERLGFVTRATHGPHCELEFRPTGSVQQGGKK